MPMLRSLGLRRLLRQTPADRVRCLPRSIGTEGIMLRRANLRPVEAAVSANWTDSSRGEPAAILESPQATRLREASSWQAHLLLQPRLRLNASRGFTLVELLVSFGVLVLLVFFVTSLVNSAATITTLGHKQMDADSQARQFLDRMAIDFAKMVKRNDLDF